MSTIDQTIAVVGDVGVQIAVTLFDASTNAAKDISAATTTEFKLRKPDATVVTWSASFATDGTDGRLAYVTITGDLDQAGVWLLETRIVAGTQDYRSVTQSQFRVRGAI